jgi:signal transduction histidine kinase
LIERIGGVSHRRRRHPFALVAVRESLTNALERTRRLTFDLQPSVLSARGLQPALSQLALELGAQMGAEIQVDVTASRLPPAVEQMPIGPRVS